jgi:hypothetical protein
MNRELARKVADAVLYEGYMLYPYRPSAIKNRQRWCFGILYPSPYSEVRTGNERCTMHTECLLQARDGAALAIELRFLHLRARQVQQLVEDRLEGVASLLVDDRCIESWDEGVERSMELSVALPQPSPHREQISFSSSYETEAVQDQSGKTVGFLTRTQHEIAGNVSLVSEEIREDVLKLTIEVTNASAVPAEIERNSALLRSLVSAHLILTVTDGQFISLLDPPGELREAVRRCNNMGNFPVLVGSAPERNMLLCSPIILYDYPEVAPESAGDFYDATEMDEMLTLRVMTLTDEEKSEARLADDHARNLLQRTEESAREQLMRTHGVIRSMRPAGEDQ